MITGTTLTTAVSLLQQSEIFQEVGYYELLCKLNFELETITVWKVQSCKHHKTFLYPIIWLVKEANILGCFQLWTLYRFWFWYKLWILWLLYPTRTESEPARVKMHHYPQTLIRSRVAPEMFSLLFTLKLQYQNHKRIRIWLIVLPPEYLCLMHSYTTLHEVSHFNWKENVNI